MLIGVPREIKNREYRVGLVPASARELTARGHQVLVESGAGAGMGVADAAYLQAGAQIAESATDIWQRAELVVKVKEPQAVERAQLRHGQTLFTYLHLAADPPQAHDLLACGAAAPCLITRALVTRMQAGALSSSILRLTRAAAARPRGPPRTTPPRMSPMAWFTTALPTCPARCRAHRHSHSVTPLCRSSCNWPPQACRLRCAPIRTCAPV